MTTQNPSKKNRAGSKALKEKKAELFCQFYAGSSVYPLFGNATACYLAAYGGAERISEIEEELEAIPEIVANREEILALKAEKRKIYNRGNNLGPRLVAENKSVQDRINFLMDKWLDDEMMDREIAYTIAQRRDLASKVMAYDRVLKVKNRLSEKLTGELVVRWEEDEEKPASGKKKKIRKEVKKQVDEAIEGLEWEGEERSGD